MKRLTGVVATVACLLMSSIAGAQTLSCSSAVTLNGPVVEVTAVDGEDTENLQCALTEAAAQGFREVLLTSSAYEIGAISVTGFNGDLTGISQAATSVRVLDGSLSCSDNVSAALTFNVGNTAVRKMTISTDSPCGNGGDAALIGFFSNPNSCTTRTTFGNVDRVALAGTGVNGSDLVAGVVMAEAPNCDAETQKVLGTLRVNRSSLTDLDFGVTSTVAGGGQVDINFNEFTRIGLPISILDASQNTTILNNTINYNDAPGYFLGGGLGTFGIFVGNTAQSPATNSTTIRANTFNDGGVTIAGVAVVTGQVDKVINHSMVVSGNTFNGNDSNTGGSGIAATDTTGGLVSGNRFAGFASDWVNLQSGDLGVTVSGWAIVSNNFNPSTATTDIRLGTGTSGIVVGRAQNSPEVDDTTGDNDVLESAP
ncbi:MAG: hypothetical protein AAGG55_14955 [Pseudomonadota bacterium]